MPWGKRVRVPLEVRFWSKVDKTPGNGPNGDCWQWKGGSRGSRKSRLSDYFYGGFRYEGEVVLAHRVSFILTYGPIPAEEKVLHQCDNPGCVRPDHLFQGTQADNIRDAYSKGRKGKVNPVSVLAIRSRFAAGDLQKDIALTFGITEANVSVICRNLTWKNVIPSPSLQEAPHDAIPAPSLS